jgi:hypothetical protein
VIDSYEFGTVVVDGARYEADVIIFPDRVESNWWRKEGHKLQIEDLGTVLEYGPDVLLVGTGAHGVMEVPQSVIETCQSRGIQVSVFRTAEAVERFNAYLAEGKKAVAALHLTC